MSIKSILLHMDNNGRSKSCLDAALSLADRFDAHVTGLANRLPAYIPAYAAAQIPPEVFTNFDAAQASMLKTSKAEFEDAFKIASRISRCNWEVGEGDLANTIATRSRYHDLIILRQETDNSSMNGYENIPDEIILAAGRPVLIIPYINHGEAFGKSILVAWDNSRESARAVNDAMPFLKHADNVNIFSGNPKVDEEVPAAQLARYMSEHGIKPEVNRTIASNISIGDMLLNDVADNGHDMIVMGGYGHQRLREMLLGGTTRHILQHMTVPVLFSH